MTDPRTGEVLAVASRRGDRNFGIPAFTDPYEPGSTVKPFLIATLLQENLAGLDDRVDVEMGEWRTPHRTIRDVHGYDTLSVELWTLIGVGLRPSLRDDRDSPRPTNGRWSPASRSPSAMASPSPSKRWSAKPSEHS